MDDFWRARIRAAWFGLGHLTIGAGIMAMAISNAEHSVWSLPQFAFGGALVTQGFLHLTTAWNIQPPADPHPLANGPDRVDVPPAPAEQGVPALEAEGLILHQNLLPNYPGLGIGGDVDPANVMVVVYQANVVAQFNPANIVGVVGQANVVAEINPANDVDEAVQANVGQGAVPDEIIVDEADQEISDDEDDPSNALEEGDLANDPGEVDPANVIN